MSGPAAPPPPGTPVPRIAYRLAGNDPIELVWLNELGGLTVRFGDRFLKCSPAGAPDLDEERARLDWARHFVTVPQILDHGRDSDGQWMLTCALPGRSAVDPYWLARPHEAVVAIGRGLRRLHDTLPVRGCPFDWSPATRVGPDTLAQLGDIPTIDQLVVCHGDPCAPNTIVADDGMCAGHVDFDMLGIADRWADLAVATWSLEWNYGDDWSQQLLDAYGVAADPIRIDYYRRLWDLS